LSPPNNTSPHIHFFHLAPLFSTNKQQKEIIDDSNIAAYFDGHISDVRIVDYNLSKKIGGDIVTYSDSITAPLAGNDREAISMSINFSGTIIQDGDIIKVTSTTDGASQELTKTILEAYDFMTVYFNGMDVEVEYTWAMEPQEKIARWWSTAWLLIMAPAMKMMMMRLMNPSVS
jgi:hypothetical protein